MRRVQTVAGKLMRKPSEQDMHERRLLVRQLHASGMPTADIVEQTTSRLDIAPEAVRRILHEIRAELKAERELFAPSNQAAALERLYSHLVRLNSELAVMRNATAKDYKAIRAHASEVRHYEHLIAEMEGTLKPLQVEHIHGMTETLSRALSTMTPELTEQAIREELEREKNARSITTTSTDAPPSPAQEKTPPRRGRGQPLPALSQPPVLDSPPEARRVVGSTSEPLSSEGPVRPGVDPDVGGRPGQRGLSVRVVT